MALSATIGSLLFLVVLAFGLVKAVVTKIVSDEVRARVDDLPAVFVGIALRRLPVEMREFYRVDWEGGLLAAFNDETSRYPVTRLFRSFRFGFSLILGARQISRETRASSKRVARAYMRVELAAPLGSLQLLSRTQLRAWKAWNARRLRESNVDLVIKRDRAYWVQLVEVSS